MEPPEPTTLNFNTGDSLDFVNAQKSYYDETVSTRTQQRNEEKFRDLFVDNYIQRNQEIIDNFLSGYSIDKTQFADSEKLKRILDLENLDSQIDVTEIENYINETLNLEEEIFSLVERYNQLLEENKKLRTILIDNNIELGN